MSPFYFSNVNFSSVCDMFFPGRPILPLLRRHISEMRELFISSDTFLRPPQAYVDFHDSVHFRGEISRALSYVLSRVAHVFVRNSLRGRVCICVPGREQVPSCILYVSLPWRWYRKSPETARVIYKLRIFGILSAKSRFSLSYNVLP